MLGCFWMPHPLGLGCCWSRSATWRWPPHPRRPGRRGDRGQQGVAAAVAAGAAAPEIGGQCWRNRGGRHRRPPAAAAAAAEEAHSALPLRSRWTPAEASRAPPPPPAEAGAVAGAACGKPTPVLPTAPRPCVRAETEAKAANGEAPKGFGAGGLVAEQSGLPGAAAVEPEPEPEPSSVSKPSAESAEAAKHSSVESSVAELRPCPPPCRVPPDERPGSFALGFDGILLGSGCAARKPEAETSPGSMGR
mmetsp:Transcript_100064/g.268779  ORF Transcript_100064/g.268779 Transcript_100064/m.268779 type:complete len:248 (+) Transcript_100064:171-914(+)